jgi:uncharacterized protein
VTAGRTRAPLGWPLLPVPDATGQLAFPTTLDESVRQSIRVILTTRPGELLFHPEFGAGLDRFLDQPNSLALRREVHDSIVDSLTRWEPRIDLDRVDVDELPEAPASLRVRIAYRLKRTGAAQSLGLTMTGGG